MQTVARPIWQHTVALAHLPTCTANTKHHLMHKMQPSLQHASCNTAAERLPLSTCTEAHQPSQACRQPQLPPHCWQGHPTPSLGRQPCAWHSEEQMAAGEALAWLSGTRFLRRGPSPCCSGPAPAPGRSSRHAGRARCTGRPPPAASRPPLRPAPQIQFAGAAVTLQAAFQAPAGLNLARVLSAWRSAQQKQTAAVQQHKLSRQAHPINLHPILSQDPAISICLDLPLKLPDGQATIIWRRLPAQSSRVPAQLHNSELLRGARRGCADPDGSCCAEWAAPILHRNIQHICMIVWISCRLPQPLAAAHSRPVCSVAGLPDTQAAFLYSQHRHGGCTDEHPVHHSLCPQL